MAEIAANSLAASGSWCPALLIMVGAPGSGKSYLGRTLSVALGAELIQTDAVRKELFPEPSYTPGEASTVYATCHRRIAEALARGECVVFDGTNLRERRRTNLYRLAERARAKVLVVVAYASDAVIRARLRQRAEGRDQDDHSDADVTVYLRMRRDTEPIPRPHIVVNTAAAPGPVIRLLQHHLTEGRGARDEGRAGKQAIGPREGSPRSPRP
jgi:predicted kinase